MVAITLGADVEVFVKKPDGKMSCAIGILGGDKEHPRIVPCGNVQEDNVLAEFAIDVAHTKEEWLRHISIVRQCMYDILAEHRLQPVITSSYYYTKQEMLSFGPAALVLGCSTDENVYTRRDNPRPNAYQGLRTAGGHIHVGGMECDPENLVKCLDYTLGLWSVLLDRDKTRRDLYGKAGDYRMKPYGIEYRTLSNFWIANEERMAWVYDTTHMLAQKADSLLHKFRLVLGEGRLVEIINTGNVEQAGVFYPIIAEVVENELTS